jgi:hypothetical protein
VRGVTAEAELDNPDFLAKLASGAVWGFTVVVAVNQIGVATALVNTLFMAVVGALALALGLSFGLGGREAAAEIIRHWRERARSQKGRIERAADMVGERSRQEMKGVPAMTKPSQKT